MFEGKASQLSSSGQNGSNSSAGVEGDNIEGNPKQNQGSAAGTQGDSAQQGNVQGVGGELKDTNPQPSAGTDSITQNRTATEQTGSNGGQNSNPSTG